MAVGEALSLLDWDGTEGRETSATKFEDIGVTKAWLVEGRMSCVCSTETLKKLLVQMLQ